MRSSSLSASALALVVSLSVCGGPRSGPAGAATTPTLTPAVLTIGDLERTGTKRDWDEFKQVIRGNGPCNRERMEARRKAHEDGEWVREALAAYAEKQASGQVEARS